MTPKRKHIQIKCPICGGKTQSPSTQQYHKKKLSKRQISARHCRKCNLIIPVDPKLGYWDGYNVIRAASRQYLGHN